MVKELVPILACPAQHRPGTCIGRVVGRDVLHGKDLVDPQKVTQWIRVALLQVLLVDPGLCHLVGDGERRKYLLRLIPDKLPDLPG